MIRPPAAAGPVEGDSLRAIVESISGELELRPLLTGVIEKACALIGAQGGVIGLYDEARNAMVVKAAFGLPESVLDAPPLPPGVGLGGQVLVTRKPVVLERYADVPGAADWGSLNDYAAVGAPILSGARLLGYFTVSAPPPRRFSAHDVETLTLFARHAAIAIENAHRYERERRRTERLALIARSVRMITEGLELEQVLQRAADAIHELLGYPDIAVATVAPDDPGTLVVRAMAGRRRALFPGEARFGMDKGIAGAAARERRVVLVDDVSRDARYVPWPTPPGESHAPGVKAELAIPILLGQELLGVLNVESGEEIGEEDARSLEIVADHLAVAVRNAQLFEQAREQAALLERQRLARDLHDSVTQLLFSVTLIAQSLGPAFRRDASEGEQKLERLLELTRAALAEMRALLTQLRPGEPVLELPRAESALVGISRVRQLGLAEAVRRYAGDIAQGGLQIEVDASGYARQPFEREEVLYRIAQEALNNVVKHARARSVTVTLRCSGAALHLSVADDGVGPAASDAPPAGGAGLGGLGILGMRERALALAGRLRIVPRDGGGTLVEVRLPASSTGESRP
jgi:signal transduction histidine kinase